MISDAAYIIVLLISVIAIVGGFAIVWIVDKQPNARPEPAINDDGNAVGEEDDDDQGAGRRNRRRIVGRNAARHQQAAQVVEVQHTDGGDSDDDEFDGEVDRSAPGGNKKIGTKKLAKLQIKEQRRQEREAMEELRRARKARELVEEQERLARKQKEAEEKFNEVYGSEHTWRLCWVGLG
jgi:hypothetical protein